MTVPARVSKSAFKIDFPAELPISARRAEIGAALAAHQVVIVCGETGSGKTTQLPKILLAMGRGRARLIGHTQPRRIAASSVARRIAEELKTPLGEVVGYKVRFQDRVAAGASIKLMTDGILLAEAQADPELAAYDAIIIDEAHERSLNIDFLLGYLRQLLPRRPDLKLIVTSATIDAERFARHFADGEGTPAPVLMVSGRTWPVELRWRPFEESRDFGLNEAIADAVDELWREPGRQGDILVFLPGEREIREAADHLRKHLAARPVLRTTEVLPLFARLSQAEQERVFAPHGHRRIVLATNVAETSLTVPGIKYVIDSGTARVKRYSYRSKVEQLLVEPISRAAADQRAGRCGRVSDGVCIRLYDEQDFAARPRFTDPEVLRSSLAAVILRMKALGLLAAGGRVEDFPFIDAPSGRAVADGFQLLAELGAVDETQALTSMGAQLARLPLDPRVGRMILEARQRGALREVLVIASALSVQDVRDRPLEQQAQADQAHAKFDDEKSEFSGYLRLWRWLHDARGGQAARTRREMAVREGRDRARTGARHAALATAQRAQLAMAQARRVLAGQGTAVPVEPEAATHKLSQRQWESLLRQNFISVRRVREWRDIHTQLRTVASEHRWDENAQPAGYDAVHKSLLAGLLGNVGCRMATEPDARQASAEYLGARGIRFFRHPGAHLAKRPGQWIVCAELVETTRLFGRGIATIEPQWLEELGGHLLKKQLLEPHWDKKACDVIALERATLYGLVVYSGRRRSFGAADPQLAREIFIREALVAGDWAEDWARRLPFLAANARTIAQVQDLEHKSRRQDVLVDDALIHAFYDRQVPQGISNGRDFEAWWRQASKANPRLLQLTRDELMRHEAAGITTAAFPTVIRLGGIDCNAGYLHQPGDARDGLTVTLPLFVLNQVSEERCEWLVPGMLRDKILALLKSLPQRPRARLVPLPQTATRLAQQLGEAQAFGRGSLLDALLTQVREATGLDVRRSDFKPDMVPAHLMMNFRVADEHGRQLGAGRNLAALKAEWGGQARGAFQALAGLKTRVASRVAETKESDARSSETGFVSTPSARKPEKQISGDTRYTAWSFGELPELLEIQRKGQALIGFPALTDAGDAVMITVLDDPQAAARQHRLGLRRLFALQCRDTLKHLEKNIPDLNRMAAAFMQVGRAAGKGGTAEQLREQIIQVALERAFLADPWPGDQQAFEQRLEEGRPRLALIAGEVARLADVILVEHALVIRKIRDSKGAPETMRDATEQLERLMPLDFLTATPWASLQHFPRYLKAIVLRLEKLRVDPARDARHMAQVRAQEQRLWRLIAERKSVPDTRLESLRWLLEELRVSLFAQELRTAQPVSVKRLEKMWEQLR